MKRTYQLRPPHLREAAKKYYHQKRGAKKRKIEWHFTFEEWVQWWKDNLGPDWIKKRGAGIDQYQMARRGDRGPYAVWNVDCLTARQNRGDAIKNGAAVGRPRKVTAQQVAEAERMFLAGHSTSEVVKRTGLTSALLVYHVGNRIDVLRRNNISSLTFKKGKHLTTIYL